MTRLKDGEPMPDGIEAKMLAWGADPDKYRAMCDLLLTTMAQKVIDLEKSGQERDRRLQQLESEVKAIKENDIAITKKLEELSAHLSEVMIKFNTWKNSVSASDRMTEKLRTEFAQMLQDLQAISSRLQDLESRAIDKDSAKQLHRDLTSAIASFDEQYDKMSRLAESTDSPEKVAFLECPVEEGIAGASVTAPDASEQAQRGRQRHTKRGPVTTKDMDTFWKRYHHFDRLYQEKPPRHEARFIWSFIEGEGHKKSMMAICVQKVIAASCPLAKNLRHTGRGRQINIDNVKWPEVARALINANDQLEGHLQRYLKKQRAAINAKNRAQRSSPDILQGE